MAFLELIVNHTVGRLSAIFTGNTFVALYNKFPSKTGLLQNERGWLQSKAFIPLVLLGLLFSIKVDLNPKNG